jgi:hypothetical protein
VPVLATGTNGEVKHHEEYHEHQPLGAMASVLSPIGTGLQALMHAQTIQNQLILSLLESCSLEMNMHVQAVQNQLILKLLEACNIGTVHANVPLVKQWLDLNPTLQSLVREILEKRTSVVPTPSHSRGKPSDGFTGIKLFFR